MQLTQKKICGSCKALNPASGNCELEFKTKNIRPLDSILPVPKYVPVEPCYKPVTTSEYLVARELVA